MTTGPSKITKCHRCDTKMLAGSPPLCKSCFVQTVLETCPGVRLDGDKLIGIRLNEKGLRYLPKARRQEVARRAGRHGAR
jgi:hypothetical protein